MEHLLIRDFREGDEEALRQVFLSAVVELTSAEYSAAQRAAWAACAQSEGWTQRMRAVRPVIAQLDAIAGYVSVHPPGFIDHLYVAAPYARRGLGAALLAHVERAACEQLLPELCADVSLSAERFFRDHGYVEQRRNWVVLDGVPMTNVRMCKRLAREMY